VSHPFPRSPAEVAAAAARLSASGACCGHTFAAHAPDGCRVCQLQHRGPETACAGWQPVDPWNDPADPPNSYVAGVEDTGALPCSSPGCGDRADQHRTDESQPTGLGPCEVIGCRCRGWSYVIPDTGDDDAGDVVDAEVLAPVHDAIRAALEGSGSAPRYVAPAYVDAAVAAVVSALEAHAGDVADYLRLGNDDAVAVLRNLATADERRERAAAAADRARDRAREFLAALGVQVG
jgi:hypothetical protein